MCVGGISRAAARPASARHRARCGCSRIRTGRQSIAGLRLVLLAFFAVPRRVRPGGSPLRARASGCPPAASRAPRSPPSCRWRCVLMSAVLVAAAPARRLRRVARPRRRSAWSLGAAGLALASVLVPLLAGAAPLVVLVVRLPRHRGARRAARLHAGADLAHLPARHRRRQPDHPADQDPRRRRLVRPARDPALHPRRRADGVGRHLRAHRRSRDGDRRARARRPRDGRGRGGDPLLGHLRLDRGRRLGHQLAARALDAEGRLLGTRGRQRRRRRLRDGHPGAAVPDDGGARIAGEPVDRDAVPGRLRAGVHARGRAARADRGARAAPGLAGQRPRATRPTLARAARRAAVPLGLPVMLFGGIFSGLDDGHRGGAASPWSTRSSPACSWAASGATSCRAARAERRRHRDDAVGAGRGLGVCVDPGARMGAADARRVDRRRRRRPRRLPGDDRRRCSSSSARCSRGCPRS